MEGNIIYSSPFGVVYEDEMVKIDTPDEIEGDHEDNISRVFVLGRDWVRVSIIAEKSESDMLICYDSTPFSIVTLWGHVNHDKKCLDKFVASIGSSIEIGGNARIVSLYNPGSFRGGGAERLLTKIFLGNNNVTVTGE